MAVSPTYPGVYVQEVPSGVRSIAAVGTSTTLFLGATKAGPLNEPRLVLSYTDFKNAFSDDISVGDMAHYVRLFFLNGGSKAYVMRLAHGATFASVELRRDDGATEALTLEAKSPGRIGESIRAVVTYKGSQPESTFAVELFRWDDSGGARTAVARELWSNLSMDPNSPAYAVDFLSQNSRLVNASIGTDPTGGQGFSRAGRVVETLNDPADFVSTWTPLLGTILVSVGGSDFTPVDLSGIALAAGADVPTTAGTLAGEIENAINTELGGTVVAAALDAGPTARAGGSVTRRLTLRATTAGDDVLVRPAPGSAMATELMLGTAQGGLEVGAFAAARPAPNAITLPGVTALDSFADQASTAITQLTLDGFDASGAPAAHNIAVDLDTTGSGHDMWVDAAATTLVDNSNGVLEKLGLLRDAVNAHRDANSRTFFWRAELWGNRLAIIPTAGEDNALSTALATSPTDIASDCIVNVRHYTVGALGFSTGFQASPAAAASDGDPPHASDYDAAYPIIRREVDLFNLMVLPPSRGTGALANHNSLYPNASVFCQQERAFLIMDPPASWQGVQTPLNEISDQRIGLVADHAAMHYPMIRINHQGRELDIGPSGAMAGLYARIDGQRGVWKAPAGTEATLRGVVGLHQRLSDVENGVINPEGLNALRVLPAGIVSWGARTMDGADAAASEYKYTPIRRLALNIEESLYRGLQWTVFEPNDEGLWAQIRLNVGAFMHSLFRKGAFEGQKPSDAYFVKCDSETTTATDRNLGTVNIWVGFAPLKPAEFVVLYLQQMAGQIAT